MRKFYAPARQAVEPGLRPRPRPVPVFTPGRGAAVKLEAPAPATGKVHKLALAAGLALLPAMYSSAAVIDSFLLPPGGTTLTRTSGGVSTDTQVGLGATAIGGQRELTLAVTSTSGIFGSTIKINNGPGGTADLNSDAYTDASAIFAYGKGGDLNANLSMGGASTGFLVRVNAADLVSLTNSVTVSTTGLGSSTALFTVPVVPSEPVDVFVPYASFVGSASFSDVDQIAVTVNGPRASDYSIGFIKTNAVPEPASLGFLGAGVGMVLKRRRRLQSLAV